MNNLDMDKLLKKCISDSDDLVNKDKFENNVRRFINLSFSLKDLNINEPYNYLVSLYDKVIDNITIINNSNFDFNDINYEYYIYANMNYKYLACHEPFNTYCMYIYFMPTKIEKVNNEGDEEIIIDYSKEVYMEIKFSNILYEEIWRNMILPKLNKELILYLIDKCCDILNITDKDRLIIYGLDDHEGIDYCYDDFTSSKPIKIEPYCLG